VVLQIIIGYSWWYLLVCLLVASVYAIILYFRTKKIETPFKWANQVLPFVRGTLVFFIVFLLLKPLIKYTSFRSEKPILIVALDKSMSMVSGKNGIDSNEFSNTISKKFQSLNNEFQIERVEFGSSASPVSDFSPDYKLNSTNISAVLNYNLAQRFRNVAASVIISDGIYNEGINPLSIVDNQKHPIYTIGTGDTSIKKDLMVKQVLHNSVAYLGSQFPVRIEIQAEKLQGKNSILQISQDGQVVHTGKIEIDDNSYYSEIDVVLNADKVGFQRYTVSVQGVSGETNLDNNVVQIFVEVLDARKKVSIVSNYPHPDIGALSQALKAFDNYDVQVHIGDLKILGNSDLVIFYGSYKNQSDVEYVKKLVDKNISILHILDERYNPAFFNQNPYGITFNIEGSGFVSGNPVYNSSFDYFEISDKIQQTINSWSPLNQRYGKFSGFKPEQILLYQKIGSVLTDQPAMILGLKDNLRFGIVSGNGFWRWRLLSFEKDGSHESHSGFWNKIIQFLSVKKEQKRLKVVPTKKLYTTGENIILQGELLNKNLESVTSSEIKVQMVQSQEGKEKQYSYVMNAQESNYLLRLSNLEAGDYSYTATTSLGGEVLVDKGVFAVSGIQKEKSKLVADHILLANLAAQTGGKFYQENEMNQLIESLKNQTKFKEIVYQENQMNDLIDWKWLFWLILALITFEWFVRKISTGI
jgi:hypothetical protein